MTLRIEDWIGRIGNWFGSKPFWVEVVTVTLLVATTLISFGLLIEGRPWDAVKAAEIAVTILVSAVAAGLLVAAAGGALTLISNRRRKRMKHHETGA